MEDRITISEIEAYSVLVNIGVIPLSNKKNDRKAVHEAADKFIALAEKIKKERDKSAF